jgi:hypothetical protein
MPDDLILAVMKNVHWHDVDCFALSLARTNSKACKVFFVENITEEASDKLNSMGYHLITFTTDAEALSSHFQTSRYIPAATYLEKHWNEYRWIMWTDVWDVVFQADPFAWLEENAGDAKLIAAEEGWLIKNQAMNDIWIEKLVSPQEYQHLREGEVYCSGTIFGEARAMKTLLETIACWVKSGDGMQGLDQGMYNVLLRSSPFSQIMRAPTPDEAFIATCGPFLAPSNRDHWTIDPPIFDRTTGLVFNQQGKRYCLVHQYNRVGGEFNPNGDWRAILERRYRESQ